MLFPVMLANVFFNESTYSIDENGGQVHLFLSNQLSVDLTIQIKDKSNTAIG